VLTVVLLQAMVAGVNLAIPSLAASDLHPSHTDLVWIVDAYVLVFAALLIPLGALGDRIGRKRAVLGGLALFAASCVVSALAPNVATLQAGRALGGAAAALAQPATLAPSAAGRRGRSSPPSPRASPSWPRSRGAGCAAAARCSIRVCSRPVGARGRGGRGRVVPGAVRAVLRQRAVPAGREGLLPLRTGFAILPWPPG
jgi:MFS family permease